MGSRFYIGDGYKGGEADVLAHSYGLQNRAKNTREQQNRTTNNGIHVNAQRD